MKFDLYDFDGTIYDGDSGVDIILFAIKKKPYLVFYLLTVLGSVLLYFLKLRTKEQMKSKIFKIFTYFDDINSFIDDFWKKHERKLKKFWLEKKNHSKDIIISASCRIWLEPIANKYKVYDLFATEMDIKTGKIIGDNCHGKEKVNLFYKKYPKGIMSKMYTDSVNDLPLIEEAKDGYLVKRNKIYNYYDYKPNFIVRFWNFGWSIYHKNEEVWNYLIVGFLTTLVNLLVKWSLLLTVFDSKNALELQIAIIISWIAAVIFAYITNKVFVFKSKNKNIIKESISFLGSRLLTLFMEMGLMWFFVTLLELNTAILVFIITIMVQFIIVVCNYILSKLFVFKKGGKNV